MVHLLFHPPFGSARELARYVPTQLNEDAIPPGLRSPAMFTATTADGGPPAGLAFNHAKKNFVVMLTDNHLIIDGVWGRYVADVRQNVRQDQKRDTSRYI
jgi:hypothetical protein